MLLYVSFFCSVTLVLYGLMTAGRERRQAVRRRLNRFVAGGKPGAGEAGSEAVIASDGQPDKKERPLWKRLLHPLWREFKKSFRRRIPGEKEAKIEIRLMQAGQPLGMSAVEFRMLQLSVFFLLPVVAGFYAVMIGMGIGGIVLLVAGGMAIALLLPNYYIALRIKHRGKLALRELPDVLDLLTVSLEAGLGFDAALSKLVAKKRGVLTSEFQRCLEEIRLGKTRREALGGLRDRVACDEIRTLISSILQAEKLGIGLVKVLRVQSQEVREQRKQRAEEAAMKAPIKMLFPLVLFIFPCLFIVLLGPAAIQFLETFGG